MASPMTAAQHQAAMTKWHVDYHLFSGYDGRGRPGTWAPEGIIIHHTGSNSQTDGYLTFLFVDGRPEDGIPGPLCNVATDADGDLWLGATGRANHAGSGDQSTLDKVRNPGTWDGYNTTINPGTDDLVGNGFFYGNELRYDGAVPPSGAMYVTVVLWCAAICDFHGWTAEKVIGHKEWTGRKNDPGNVNMAALRRDVRDALAVGPGNWPTMGDDVALTQAQIEQLAKAGWLADQFAQGAQFEEQLDRLEALLNTSAGKETSLATAVAAVQASLTAVQTALTTLQTTATDTQIAVGQGWGTQIGDVLTPDPVDGFSASNHIAYMPVRTGDVVAAEVQPLFDQVNNGIQAILVAIDEHATPPPAPLA